MAKEKTIFFCKECGYEISKWQGQCPGCHAWNTLVEAPAAKKGKTASGVAGHRMTVQAKPMKISEIEAGEESRKQTGMAELDRVLGGNGEELLFFGEPVDLVNLLVINGWPVDDCLNKKRVVWIVAVKKLGQASTGRLLMVVDIAGPDNHDFLVALLLGDVVWD